MRASLVVAAVGLAWPSALSGQDAPGRRRVLLISCDGLRPDAIDLADAPVLNGLISTGSYQATCLNEMPPVTLPNHTSMVTGQNVQRHGVYANSVLPGRVQAKTIFDAANEAGLGVGFFIGKGKLAFLCEEGTSRAWHVSGEAEALAGEVARAVREEDLELIFVHLAGADGAGHRHGWMSEAYLTEVARIDAAIGVILDALETAGVLASTTLLVTADHGGHQNTHFLDIAEDRFIPFIINGPGIASGRTLCEQVRITDVAATVLHLLGLPADLATDGRFVVEATVDFAQTECSAPEVHFTVLCGTLPPILTMPLGGLLIRTRRRG